MTKPATRTVIVLGALIGAMTICSALLLLLEPRPRGVMGGASGLPLQQLDTVPSDGLGHVLVTQPPPTAERWQVIAIHFSGRGEGSVATMGANANAYHFIINNGTAGLKDGQIEMTEAWLRQLKVAPGQPGYERNAVIDIRLIGDGTRSEPTASQMSQLVALTCLLQTKLAIPADHVITPHSRGKPYLFNAAAFESQLANVPAR